VREGLVELENNRYDNLCRGFASDVKDNFENKHVGIEAKKKFDQILAAKVNEVSCYCPGCWINLSGLGKKNNIKVYYAINKVLRAFEDGAPASKKDKK
jgi:Fe-S oxidoreductase